MTDIDYAPMRREEEEPLSRVLADAFGFEPLDCPAWFDSAGRDNVRVVHDGQAPIGGLLLLPMAQFFGGRAVSMTGLAGVAIRADRRRRGLASAMMSATLHELARRDVALSTLYASTQSLYRRSGWEAAGSRFVASLHPREIRADERSLRIRVAEPSDRVRIHELYRKSAARHDGHLDRGAYIWRRLDDSRFGVRAQGLVVEDEHGTLEGYVWYRQRRGDDRTLVEITDLQASTARGWQAVWTAIGDLGSIVKEISFNTAPHDPAYLAHFDPLFQVRLMENWMMRIVDVRRALGERGYPTSLRTTVELEVADDVLAHNSGRLVLTIADGRASVREGGSGAIAVDVRGLAALYGGLASPWTVAARGQLAAAEGALEQLAGVFAGPLPWMREMF